MSGSQDPLAVARVQKLAKHVRDGFPLKALPVTAKAVSEATASVRSQERHFVRGLLAHLLLVPPWITPPAALLASLVGAGLPFGKKGVLSTLGLGAALATGPPNVVRALICAAIAAVAARSKKITAMASAVTVSVMCWAVSTTASPGPRPNIVAFIKRWASHYYAKAEVRGALDDIRKDNTFLGFHPHGCLCAGWTINGTFNPKMLAAVGKIAWLCDPALRHRNPGFRWLCDAYASSEHVIEGCDSASFKKYMAQGTNVAFIIGGFLDAVAFVYGKDRAVLKSRTAFIKYCLQFGYRVHPVYTFGECETFRTFTGLQDFRMRIALNNIPMIAFMGWPLVPFLPFPESKIVTYVGKGIDFPRIAEPSNFDVAHWHAIYTAALRQVFEENKAEAGWPNAELEIL